MDKKLAGIDLTIGAIARGFWVTLKHFYNNIMYGREIATIDYPSRERGISPRWRGLHRLTTRPDGQVKCVACFLCATACPAQCIYIEAEEAPEPYIEKRPKKFEIDLLRCVFCGLCVEACPVDAIRMDTMVYTLVGNSR
ncbi:MAG: NuoI/complex I 23 kDa subunit family protein, partial [Planctomycetota bacterium]